MPLAWWYRALLRILRPLLSVQHVAFIMDGNRRYARHLGMQVAQGHRKGLSKLLEVVQVCRLLGVRVVTVYGFSLQNFHRSAAEICDLMSIASESASTGGSLREFAERESCRVRFCGDFRFVAEELREILAEVEAKSAIYDGITINICMSYGARNDIANALERSSDAGDPGDEQHAQRFYKNLVAGDVPPPQVLIRTSGETRLSDFLIYQCSEATTFYFFREEWPRLKVSSIIGALLHRTLFDGPRLTKGGFTTFQT